MHALKHGSYFALIIIFFAATFCVACSDDNGSDATDPDDQDAGFGDTSTGDANSGDTRSGDTGARDTGSGDAGFGDTSTGDTGEPETGLSDIGPDVHPMPSCDDGLQSGDQTGVDCGGPQCPPCEAGLGCSEQDDCISGVCTEGVCAAPTCEDGVQNGDETDVDCGGSECPRCEDGLNCVDDGDCINGICEEGGCAAPTCEDGVQNGDETDVDCGGSSCPECLVGQHCLVDGDCTDNVCYEGTCGSFCGGTGTEDDPWQICSVDSLLVLSDTDEYLEDHFLLTDHVDLNGVSYSPIASTFLESFDGVFDGDGYEIRNLTTSTSQWYIGAGLFSSIGSDGVVKNLGIVDADVVARVNAGPIAGSSGGVIENCYATGTAEGTGTNTDSDASYAGGLVGAQNGTIRDSWASTTVTGIEYAGGLTGQNGWGASRIVRSYATGDVYGTGGGWTGGLVGRNIGEIEQSFATGDVNGGALTGGLVGYTRLNSVISESYATGDVAGGGHVGGLVGEANGSVRNSFSTGAPSGNTEYIGGLMGENAAGNPLQNPVEHNYWDIDSSGITTSDGAEGLTPAQMADESSFHESWIFAPDDDYVWTMPDGGPPKLWWE